jgi:hypothetical protein
MSPRWLLALVLLIAVAGLIYFCLPHATEASIDPQLKARFENDQKPIVMKLIESESMLERVQLVGQLQKTIADLTETQRRELFNYARENSPELRDAFIGREQKRVDSFFKLSPDEQVNALDKHIDEMESMQKMFSGLRGGAPGGGPPGSPSGPAPGIGNADQRRQLGMQRIMNNTTPEFRAQMGEYRQRVDQRREERGLTPMRPPGP